MPANVEVITPKALAEIQRSNAVRLIDVREPHEFAQRHAKGATNIPLAELDAEEFEPSQTIYFICRGGTRGEKACERVLAKQSAARVFNVEGGTLAWQAAGLPTAKAKKPWTLARKINTVSVALILVSFLLAIFVHRGLLGIAALVGAVLVFFAMTDMCGLGDLFGRMPWNEHRFQKSSAESSSPPRTATRPE
jgi:rhodanese-related sulfurtransferase